MNHPQVDVDYGEVNVLSKRMRSSRADTNRSSMEPKMTAEGKYLCEADNRIFDTRDDFDRHCSSAHISR
jgi:hypothetical protein